MKKEEEKEKMIEGPEEGLVGPAPASSEGRITWKFAELDKRLSEAGRGIRDHGCLISKGAAGSVYCGCQPLVF